MSLFNLRNIREISTDPLAKFANEVAKKVSRFVTKDQLDLLEDKEDIYVNGIDFDSVVRIHDDLLSTKTFEFDKEYYPPLEPDNDKLRLWIRGANLGNNLANWSAIGRTVRIYGDPLLIDGTPFDLGIHDGGVKSTCIRFNRPTSPFQYQDEYIQVENLASDTMDIEHAATPGKSYFMRFRLQSKALQGGFNRRLWEKTDGSANNGIQVAVSPDGEVEAQVVLGGVTTDKKTPTDTILTNTVYDLWVTYTLAGNAIKIYVNNVDQTLVNGGGLTWHSDTSSEDIFIFRRGYGDDSGYVQGDFYDFRVYNGLVVSASQVGFFNTNKWTIADIPFGQVWISNYSACYYVAGQGYDSTGFDSTGFET